MPVENGAHNLIQGGFLDDRIHHVKHHFLTVPAHRDKGLVIRSGPGLQRRIKETRYCQVPIFQAVGMVVVNPVFLEKTAVRRRFIHLLPVEGHSAHQLLLQLEPGHRVPGLPQ